MATKRESRRKDRSLRDFQYDRFGGICQSCGVLTSFNDYRTLDGVDGHRILGPTYPTLEHLTPMSLSGRSTKDNTTLYCNKCNHDGSKTIGQCKEKSMPPSAFQLYGHSVEYGNRGGFGFTIGCPCGWSATTPMGSTSRDAEKLGLAHMRDYKFVPLKDWEKIELLEARINMLTERVSALENQS